MGEPSRQQDGTGPHDLGRRRHWRYLWSAAMAGLHVIEAYHHADRAAGDAQWEKPAGFGVEVAVYIMRHQATERRMP